MADCADLRRTFFCTLSFRPMIAPFRSPNETHTTGNQREENDRLLPEPLYAERGIPVIDSLVGTVLESLFAVDDALRALAKRVDINDCMSASSIWGVVGNLRAKKLGGMPRALATSLGKSSA